MASFTAVEDTLVLAVPIRYTSITVAISGTYDQVIALQREQGSPGSGSWADIKVFDTEDATEAYVYTTEQPNESIRLYLRTDAGGTATVTLTDSDDKSIGYATVKDGNGNIVQEWWESGTKLTGTFQRDRVVSVAAALTVTAALHAGCILVFNIAAGVTVTLPAATGTGNVYEFIVGVTVTSVADVIQVANATDEFHGHLTCVDTDTSDAVTIWPSDDGDGFDTITMNGGAKGGIMGDHITLIDYAAGKFMLRGGLNQTGTVVTPLSAAV